MSHQLKNTTSSASRVMFWFLAQALKFGFAKNAEKLKKQTGDSEVLQRWPVARRLF